MKFDDTLSLRERALLIPGGGRPAARAGVNRGIIARHASLNCGLYCWSGVGQQLQTGTRAAHRQQWDSCPVFFFFFFLENKQLLRTKQPFNTIKKFFLKTPMRTVNGTTKHARQSFTNNDTFR